jgi:hypothetical protein
VSAGLDPQQIDIAVVAAGSKVTLVLPDGTETAGTVAGVTTQAASGEDQPTQVANIAIDDQNTVPADSGPVQVRVVTETRSGVLAVPVTALLALGDLVEVSGDGLAEGMRVVRAS